MSRLVQVNLTSITSVSKVPLDAPIKFEKARVFHRVLSNLIENEIAYLPAGCQITIRLRSREQSATLVIEDNGPGIFA
jgi:signal transduction histidine kinase